MLLHAVVKTKPTESVKSHCENISFDRMKLLLQLLHISGSDYFIFYTFFILQTLVKNKKMFLNNVEKKNSNNLNTCFDTIIKILTVKSEFLIL